VLRSGLARLPLSGDVVFVVAMPQAAHLTYLAVRYCVQNTPWRPVVILNGLAATESQSIRRVLGAQATFIGLPAGVGHPQVIDALVQTQEMPFWCLDHDCLITEPIPELARSPSLREGGVGTAFFSHTDTRLGLRTPETFLMHINSPRLRSLARTYGVNAGVYSWASLPPAAADAICTVGLARGAYPQYYKDYFDTLRALSLLAVAAGCPFSYPRDFGAVCDPFQPVTHVGGTSFLRGEEPCAYHLLGGWFWHCALAAYPDAEIRSAYRLGAAFTQPHFLERLRSAADAPAASVLARLEEIVAGCP
jgi:hypothetical protein